MIANADWAARFRQELTGNILPFWMRHTVDRKNGGFFGAVDCDLRIDNQAARAAVLNARILWTFSAAARALGDAAYREVADWAYGYMADRFLDREFGGVYWTVDYLGRPLNVRKQIYAQAFAIYGLAEYYRATGRAESLEWARQLYHLIEEKSAEPMYGGYLEARHSDWSPLKDLRLSDKDMNAPKSMNTHLHVLEAYTNLLRACDDPKLRESLAALEKVIMDRIVDSGTAHFKMFFDNQWVPLSDHISFGHDIEGSWLICETADVLGDPALGNRARALAVQMAQAVYEQGLDDDGSLYYEASRSRIVDPNKHWWAQAEAVIGFYNAWQISSEQHFREAAWRVWEFIEEKVVDKIHGEWHAKLKPDGTPWTAKEDRDACMAGPWKCPYHNGRVCMEMMARLG